MSIDTSRTQGPLRPPFRADQVGSLLRPERLKQARIQFLGAEESTSNLGPHRNAGLRSVEDECIREVVAMEERIGLRSATDGEFRRRSWWLELIMTWQGVAADRLGTTEFTWRNSAGERKAFSRLWVKGPIRWQPSAIVEAFRFLKGTTRAVPKVTIPAPMVMHMYAGGDPGLREGHYQDLDLFWADVVAAYQAEVKALAAAGARYIQFDDTCMAFLCDPLHRQTVQGWGTTPEKLMAEYARRLNEVIAVLPDEVTVTLHQCRGNREGHWAAEGGYDPVAEVMFNAMNVHGYFLEYDTQRTGTFAPLRLLPAGKRVILGIVSSKDPVLESADFLKARIDEAARYAPLEQLGLSAQCGFASSTRGNPLTQADQEAKLRRIVEVAEAIWPGGR